MLVVCMALDAFHPCLTSFEASTHTKYGLRQMRYSFMYPTTLNVSELDSPFVELFLGFISILDLGCLCSYFDLV